MATTTIGFSNQTDAIMLYLQAGYKLTPMDALRKFGVFRLAARVADVKKRGVDVKKEMVKDENGKRYARYFVR